MKKKNKRFKSKKEQLFELSFYGLLLVGELYVLIGVLSQNESDLIEQWGEQQLVGSSGQRSAQAIEMFVINNFGKVGFLVFSLIIDAFFSKALSKA